MLSQGQPLLLLLLLFLVGGRVCPRDGNRERGQGLDTRRPVLVLCTDVVPSLPEISAVDAVNTEQRSPDTAQDGDQEASFPEPQGHV